MIKSFLNPEGHQKVTAILLKGGFGLLVELQRGRIYPAACAAGLFCLSLAEYKIFIRLPSEAKCMPGVLFWSWLKYAIFLEMKYVKNICKNVNIWQGLIIVSLSTASWFSPPPSRRPPQFAVEGESQGRWEPRKVKAKEGESQGRWEPRKVRARRGKWESRKVRAKEGESQPREIGVCEWAPMFALGIPRHDSQIAAPCFLTDQMSAAVLLSANHQPSPTPKE